MKVDFIGIGAQKSATTWLHHVLMRHPQIDLGREKELNYFTANYDRGALWYESQFPEPGDGRIRGETSPTYFFSSDAPVRARQYNPDLALIAVLRDPVARAFSNHLHEIRKGHIPAETTFETALARNPSYIAQGQYRANLSRWLDQFDRASLLVLFAEDIADDPAAAYATICRHLGIDAGAAGPELFERQNESIRYYNTGLQKLLRGGGDVLRTAGLGSALKSVKRTAALRTLLSLNTTHLKSEVAPMREETRQMLKELFEPDRRFVADLTGRPDLPWQTWKSAQDRSRPDETAEVQNAE